MSVQPAHIRGYRFKLYPTKDQHETMLTQCRMVGDLWNSLLHIQEDHYRRTKAQKGVTHRENDGTRESKPHLSFFDMTSLITELRHACPEWEALSVWTGHRVAKALDSAFKAFYRRARQGEGKQSGYPKFKSFRRGQHNWLPHRFASGCKLEHVRGNTWRITLKGIDGPIHARGQLPCDPARWTNADVRLKAGTWWLSVGVERERDRQAGPTPAIVKLGCIDCFAEVNGRCVYAHSVGLCDKESLGVACVQQKLSVAERGSEDARRLQIVKACLEAKLARRRHEKLHEWTTRMIGQVSELTLIVPRSVQNETESGRGNKFEHGAAVELKAKFNRHVLSMAPAMVAHMLKYKALEAGISVDVQYHDDLSLANFIVEAEKANRKLRRSIRK